MPDLGGAGVTRLLEPSATAAVVFGAHDWADAGLGRAPSFLRSARGVVAYLYDPAGLGLDPELVLDFFDDPTGAADQLVRIRDTLDMLLRERRDAGRPVADVMIYYIGHGYTNDQGHLSLLVRRSRRGMEAETGVRAPDLANVLKVAAPQQRRLVVLDCCFSEAAARSFIGMGSALDQAVAAAAAKDIRDDQPTRGGLLLCSSPVGEVSMGAPNAERTLFTGAVLDVLRTGAEGLPSALSFADLRDQAYQRMVVSFGANAPRPALHPVNQSQGDLTRLPAFPNRATSFVVARPRGQSGVDTSLLPVSTWTNPVPDEPRPDRSFRGNASFDPESSVALASDIQIDLLKHELHTLIEIDRDLLNNKEDTITASARLLGWKKRVAAIVSSDDVYKIEPDDDRRGRGMYGVLRNTIKKCRKYMDGLLAQTQFDP